MRTDTFAEILRPRNQVLWALLAFQSGFMNAGGYLACHRFVSHMTGYGTYVGVAIGRGSYLGALEMGLAPVFFVLGAFASGWLVDRPLIQGREPRLMTGMAALAALNLMVYSGEERGWFGVFGEPLELQRDFGLLFILCFACGLQNGLFHGLTGGRVRTTHLTGPATDIGVAAARLATFPADDPRRAELLALTRSRVRIAAAFSAGSVLAAVVFSVVAYEGFLVPGLISLYALAHVRLSMGSGSTNRSL